MPKHAAVLVARRMNNPIVKDDEMLAEIDLSNATRGLHHIPSGAKVFLPAFIERSVWEYFSRKAEQEGIGLADLLSETLNGEIAAETH
jgi:hypothetical protein